MDSRQRIAEIAYTQTTYTGMAREQERNLPGRAQNGDRKRLIRVTPGNLRQSHLYVIHDLKPSDIPDASSSPPPSPASDLSIAGRWEVCG
jgi:hypothetical protein